MFHPGAGRHWRQFVSSRVWKNQIFRGTWATSGYPRGFESNQGRQRRKPVLLVKGQFPDLSGTYIFIKKIRKTVQSKQGGK